jgi:hypothetical protein
MESLHFDLFEVIKTVLIFEPIFVIALHDVT